MRYFREQGSSDIEVIENLNSKFGDNYQIMTRKTVKIGGILGIGRREGVEYFGYVKEKRSGKKLLEQAVQRGAPDAGLSVPDEESRTGSEAASPVRPEKKHLADRDRLSRKEILTRFARNKEVQRILRSEIGNSLSALESERGKRSVRPAEDAAAWGGDSGPLPPAEETLPPPNFIGVSGTQKPDLLYENRFSAEIGDGRVGAPLVQDGRYHDIYHSSVRSDSRLENLEKVFVERLELLERKLFRSRGQDGEPKSVAELREGLYQNEFTPDFVDPLLSQMRRELSLDQLQNLDLVWEYVLFHIADRLRIVKLEEQAGRRTFILVGPTGVGKTTTIAKLAAGQCVKAMGGKQKVRLITLDNYRIGAQDQIRTYGEILGAEVDCIETYEELRECFEGDETSDMILIDTVGRSPKDHVKLAEMRRFLEASGSGSEVHLAVSASSSARAVRDIITEFKPFGFRSVVLTKLDEVSRIGGVLGSLLQENVGLSYLTTGQKVPQDICLADPLKLFRQLVGTGINWDDFTQKLEENMLY